MDSYGQMVNGDLSPSWWSCSLEGDLPILFLFFPASNLNTRMMTANRWVFEGSRLDKWCLLEVCFASTQPRDQHDWWLGQSLTPTFLRKSQSHRQTHTYYKANSDTQHHSVCAAALSQESTWSLLGKEWKKNVFLEISPKCVYPPTHSRVFMRFGRTKGEIRVKKGAFRGDLGFEGFGPCLGIP